MQKEEIKHLMLTKPEFAIEVAVNNNPQQVASNMAKIWGEIKEPTLDGLKDMIYGILDNGTETEKNQVFNALKVRWIPENANPTLNAAYQEIFETAQAIRVKQARQPQQINNQLMRPEAVINTGAGGNFSTARKLCYYKLANGDLRHVYCEGRPAGTILNTNQS